MSERLFKKAQQDRTSICSTNTSVGTKTIIYNFNVGIFAKMFHFEVMANFTWQPTLPTVVVVI